MTTASSHNFDLIGVGSPIMDLLAHVPEEFLATISGEKGGMVLVEPEEIESIVSRLPAAPATVAGGSAGNTAVGAARLGLNVTFLGKLGNDDTALDYRTSFMEAGGNGARFKFTTRPNARCVSLVTPDSQRTLRTCLGAAMTLAPDDITAETFADCRHAHIEGYLLFNPALADAVVTTARAAGCTLSIDIASFEVVNAARDWILAQLAQGIDIVFANEDEIRALQPDLGDDYAAHARALAKHGGIACVKMGKDGAWIARGEELHRIEPVTAPQVIDTTGAGDAWAAGFLGGHLRGYTLPAAGALGSLLGSECVCHLGPAIPADRWADIRAKADRLQSV